jgi:hypothetical protein
MLRIMADNDVLGHVRTLVQVCESPPWSDFWQETPCELISFGELGLERSANSTTIDVCRC